MESDQPFKGEFIFGPTERDRKSAAAFLVLLLDSLERWAAVESLAEDNKSPSQYVKQLVMLQQKKIFFPSQSRMSNPLADFSLVEEAKSLKVQKPA